MCVKDKWLRFFAQLPHSVSPTSGRRLSVSFYTPRLAYKVNDSLWAELHLAEFLLREYFVGKMPQAISCLGVTDSDVQAKMHLAPKKRNEEAYCCTCGALTPYECWHPDGCACFVCTRCCRLHADSDGGTTIACVHHPNQLPERLSECVSDASELQDENGNVALCASFLRRDGSHACKCRNRKKETIDTQISCVSMGSMAQRCFEERCFVASPVLVMGVTAVPAEVEVSVASPVLVTGVTAVPAEVEVDVEDEEQDLFRDEWQDELHRE
eukprot:1784243-Amphidinium_carterae.1